MWCIAVTFLGFSDLWYEHHIYNVVGKSNNELQCHFLVTNVRPKEYATPQK